MDLYWDQYGVFHLPEVILTENALALNDVEMIYVKILFI